MLGEAHGERPTVRPRSHGSEALGIRKQSLLYNLSWWVRNDLHDFLHLCSSAYFRIWWILAVHHCISVESDVPSVFKSWTAIVIV